MSSREARNKFLKFFTDKQHKVVSSAPIVVKDDPTLMFTNAGMNQFKDFFLGNRKSKDSRVADTQKCLRVSGKHNDLEEVGKDTYHHTMFEMLGNWSFGDYFKKEAIAWAWELLTEVYNIDKSKLYVTIFEGDEGDGLSADEEAFEFWKQYIEEDRILRFNKKDNFWEMGSSGPCGPCSEIHIDLRDESEKEKVDGKELVNADHPQVVEIWNLVFIQYNRLADGKLEPLPNKHVDTGMGFERLCMVLQGKQSNYDTDVFTPLISKIAELSGMKYGKSEETDIAMRVIADHLRAVTFTISDGQLPSNTGAGYVIRRILRRAVRYGYSFLGFEEAFIYKLLPLLVEQLGDVFPEVRSQQELVGKVIKEEEDAFLRTLKTGLKRIEELIDSGEFNENGTVEGAVVFELYDTFGFPVDLTRLILEEKNLKVDEAGFTTELQKQKQRSRADAAVEQGDWTVLVEDDVEEFIGYDNLQSEVIITKYRKVNVKGKDQYHLVFNLTPFYAESGGQVGDTGHIEANGEKVYIKDTKKENNLIIHYSDKLPSDTGAAFQAVVNADKRNLTANNHTATHLLHEALREVLGDHVEQKGSLVHPDHLRFDFSHFSKMTEEEIDKVERLVNERVRENIVLQEHRDTPIHEAKEMGAMALFGEKYGDVVRVIQFGESIELCGGTHVQATGQIGLFKIRSEGGIAAGVRRIEAISGPTSYQYINERLRQLEAVKELAKNPNDPVKGVRTLAEENQALRKELEKLSLSKANNVKDTLIEKAVSLKGIQFIGAVIDPLPAEAIKNLAYNLKKEVDNVFAVVGAEVDGKALLTIIMDDQLVKANGLNAGQIIREAAKEIQGGGGGQPFYATAGGKNPAGLQSAIDKTKEIVENSL